ncbi:hypothetical protein AXI59_08175 [Bacillus nakamurai]|uniref:hypothetical protein n=1 Tax=Bacillus nakamurai TaxID=1793963 RepID=UPI0007782A64|nr:hypothetical protein [Bacillus nakamurai]KXZ23562.1 hypothetical protein AXI59_08175 [Bacillus nakamurai]
MFEAAKEAVRIILQREGKPTRVSPANFRRTLGVGSWFRNEKLVRTQNYIKKVEESIEGFRLSKVKWAIEDRLKQGKDWSVYKGLLHAGFSADKEINKLVAKELNTQAEIKYDTSNLVIVSCL